MRRPTTNPKIDGEPMSFVRLGSSEEGDYGYRLRQFIDSQGVEYRRLSQGQIVGHPQTMREIKTEARRTRLHRRTNFRIEKRFAAITRKALA